MTDATGTTDTLYDVNGRVVKVTSPQGVIDYSYEAATGQLIDTATANSETQYGHDEEGRLTSITVVKRNGVALSPALVTTYGYDLNNNVTSTTLPDGVMTTNTYDSLNRLTKVVHENALGQILAEYDYTLRADGSRSKDVETELEAGGAYSTRTFDWLYDQLGRLTEEKLTSTLPGENYVDDYTYSLVGNRVELKATAANGTVTDTTSSYNARDQLLQENAVVSGSTTTTNFQYDANGSLTSKITVGGNSYGYAYNLRNQLATATIDRTEQGHAVHITASYKYDDAGIRVENDETTTIDNGTPTTQTKLFLIDGNNPTGYAQVLEQLAAAAGQAVMSYIFGHQPLGQTDSSGATKYILADGHDSTRILVDAAVNIAARFLYDAYGDILGQLVGQLNQPATDLLYSGQLFDPILLEYYLRARFYDPATGEFTSRDPFAGIDVDPVTLHRYLYGGDDPVDRYDPTGEFTLVEGLIVAAILTVILGLAYYIYGNISKNAQPSVLPQQDQTAERRTIAGQELDLGKTAKKLGGQFNYQTYGFAGNDFNHWLDNPAPIENGGFDPTDAQQFYNIQSNDFIVYALWSARKSGFSPGELPTTFNLLKQGDGSPGGAQELYDVLLNDLGYTKVLAGQQQSGDIVFLGGNDNSGQWTHEGIVGPDNQKIYHNTGVVADNGQGHVFWDNLGTGLLYFYKTQQYLRPPP